MSEYTIKGFETSLVPRFFHSFIVIVFLIALYFLSQLIISDVIALILIAGIILILILFYILSFIGYYKIEITSSKFRVRKYLMGKQILNFEFDKTWEGEIAVESKFDLVLRDNENEIKIFRHVPSFDSEDEPWISLKFNNEIISIRTTSESESIRILNEIKCALKK
jgi:hypothetical protein